MLFWDLISGVYDLFERLYNKKVFDGTGVRVAKEIDENDDVLECACGTGAISVHLAPKCRRLTATDFSTGMLRQTEKNCQKFNNVRLRHADITHLKVRDESFDKVVAGNVIHLLDDPCKAIDEMLRVCKKGGRVVIPTYINMGKKDSELLIKLFSVAGAHFTKQFDMESYKRFFKDNGYDAEFDLVDGRMPCAIAILTK